jgi:hypothetical protein
MDKLRDLLILRAHVVILNFYIMIPFTIFFLDIFYIEGIFLFRPLMSFSSILMHH